MTDPRTPLPATRPDARLVRLHAERGDPHARLSGALADLEGADWGLLLSGEDALARQLAAMLGSGTLRVDARVRVNREALAGAGLAAASLDADWSGARAVWLLEPDDEQLARAVRAGVRVIVDATLAPGGHWLAAGAALVVYRDSVTLCGHADAPLSALFGLGRVPEAAGTPPSDLSVALALRDVATLPLRLARAARTTEQLASRLGGAAQPAGPTALLLAPDAAPDTPQPLGGVRAATRSVPGGVLLTPGLEESAEALALLRGAAEPTRERESIREPREAARDTARDFTAGRPPRREEGRRDERRGEGQQDFRSGRREERARPARGDRPERPERSERNERFTRPAPDFRTGERPAPGAQEPERFVFEAPATPVAVDADPVFPTPEAAYPAVSAEQLQATDDNATNENTTNGGETGEVWEPEIVFSDTRPATPQPEAYPVPVSGGPDEPELPAGTPDLAHANLGPAEDATPQASRDNAEQPGAQPEPTGPAPEPIAPDLPSGKADPAADLTDEQIAVYARLREWRNAEAKRQEISRFIIASNATLAEIARRVPFTLDDLKAVKGMGTGRIGKYGEKILEVVRG